MDSLINAFIFLFGGLFLLFLVAGAFANNPDGLVSTFVGVFTWAAIVGTIGGALTCLEKRLSKSKTATWKDFFAGFAVITFCWVIIGTPIGIVLWVLSSV